VNSPPVPTRLNLKKDEKLEVDWADGQKSIYTIAYLRSKCPCAQCKQVRAEQQQLPKTSLRVLTGNYSVPLAAVKAELVGNYALRIDWSDEHGTGIYSFEYLKEIAPDAKVE
jgi:DUF971 family protein